MRSVNECAPRCFGGGQNRSNNCKTWQWSGRSFCGAREGQHCRGGRGPKGEEEGGSGRKGRGSDFPRPLRTATSHGKNQRDAACRHGVNDRDLKEAFIPPKTLDQSKEGGPVAIIIRVILKEPSIRIRYLQWHLLPSTLRGVTYTLRCSALDPSNYLTTSILQFADRLKILCVPTKQTSPTSVTFSGRADILLFTRILPALSQPKEQSQCRALNSGSRFPRTRPT